MIIPTRPVSVNLSNFSGAPRIGRGDPEEIKIRREGKEKYNKSDDDKKKRRKEERKQNDDETLYSPFASQ